MEFAIVELDVLKEFDKDWKYRRTSNDGLTAIIHKETLDKLMKERNEDVMMLPELDEPIEQPYPFPLVSDTEINNMPEFKPDVKDSNA